jgi:hypothetical protein
VVFRDAFQEVNEPFEYFIANARQVRLGHIQEYVWGYSEYGKMARSLTQYFPPSTHTEVTDWDDQARMLEAFVTGHGPIPDLSSHERIKVAYDHSDDILGKRRIDAIESLAVTAQVTRLMVDLQEIKLK